MKSLFRRILVPHDLSEHATRALALAAGLAAEHRGRLLVLHVIAPFQPVLGFPEGVPWSIPETDVMASARKALDSLIARTVKGRLRVESRVELGDPYQRIIDAARRADSIVIATAGRTGVSHMLIGSVAEKVVRHSPIPVLTVRPAALTTRRRKRVARKRRPRRRRA
jgi:nucleotide-binding universal stress UspA family protein